MNTFDNLYDMIKLIILKESRFYVPRIGIVSKIKDFEELGRILVLIPSLGWDTDDKGAWCYPKQIKTMITPKVDDYVLVEFIDGKREKPIWSSISYRMKDMLPDSYDGKPTTQILFEDNNKEIHIKYDELVKELLIAGDFLKIKMFNGEESFLKGTTFDAWITGTLKTIFDAHTHGGVSTGGGVTSPPSTPLTAPSNHLSDKIKGE